eukprot:415958-Pyramimonas_sp.AAC.1
MARLQELEFVFDQTQPEWERRFSELKAFHAEFGHCCVPQRITLFYGSSCANHGTDTLNTPDKSGTIKSESKLFCTYLFKRQRIHFWALEDPNLTPRP